MLGLQHRSHRGSAPACCVGMEARSQLHDDRVPSSHCFAALSKVLNDRGPEWIHATCPGRKHAYTQTIPLLAQQ